MPSVKSLKSPTQMKNKIALTKTTNQNAYTQIHTYLLNHIHACIPINICKSKCIYIKKKIQVSSESILVEWMMNIYTTMFEMHIFTNPIFHNKYK